LHVGDAGYTSIADPGGFFRPPDDLRRALPDDAHGPRGFLSVLDRHAAVELRGEVISQSPDQLAATATAGW
jgi:hypothetical protein